MNNITLKQLHEIINSVGIPVGHYEAHLDSFPYISYMETASSYSHTSGFAWRESVDVVVNHLTKDEWDPTLDKLKNALLKNKIGFITSTVWYEDLRVIHTVIQLTISHDVVYSNGREY